MIRQTNKQTNRVGSFYQNPMIRCFSVKNKISNYNISTDTVYSSQNLQVYCKTIFEFIKFALFPLENICKFGMQTCFFL